MWSICLNAGISRQVLHSTMLVVADSPDAIRDRHGSLVFQKAFHGLSVLNLVDPIS